MIKLRSDIKIAILPAHPVSKKLKAIRTPYTAAIHFILIGIMNIRRTCISGYIHANARKMDMLM